MLRVWQSQLPHAQRNPRGGPACTEKILSQRTQTHPSQGITEEVVASGPWRAPSSTARFSRVPLRIDWGSYASDEALGHGFWRGVAQLVEHRSPKPAVERSRRSAPALHRQSALSGA